MGLIPSPGQLFEDTMDEEVNDDVLLRAIRQRMLEDLRSPRQSAAPITNNVYGGGVGGGVRDSMSDADLGGVDRDYFVDIVREDLPDINEATGKPIGWKKKVHRFSTPKKKMMGEPEEY